METRLKISGEENIDLFNRGPDNFEIHLFFIKVIENRLMVAKRRGLDWEFGSSKVAYTEWIKKTRPYCMAQGTIFISYNKP